MGSPLQRRPPGREARSPAGPSRSYLARGRPRVLSVFQGVGKVLVMVGPVRGPEHLMLIHRQGYYHVPLDAIAERRVSVDYVAFYEGVSHFPHPVGCIREYASVLRISSVVRKDLPGLTWPGAKGDDAVYYRFDLGPICVLPQPITNPDRLRVVFRFPNLERFRQAATIRDLGREPSGGRVDPRDALPAKPSDPGEKATR